MKTYGWQLFGTDVVTFAGAGLLGRNLKNDDSVDVLFTSTYVLSGATHHAIKGNWRSAGLSVGTRIALPLMTGLVFGRGEPEVEEKMESCREEESSVPHSPSCEFLRDSIWTKKRKKLDGRMLGAVIALGLDYLLYARKDVEIQVEKKGLASLQPSLSMDGNGGMKLGLSGAF